MNEQTETLRPPFSGRPLPQPPSIDQGGSRGRVHHGNRPLPQPPSIYQGGSHGRVCYGNRHLPQSPSAHQGGSRGRVRQGNGAPDKLSGDQKECADRTYSGGTSDRRGLRSSLRSHRSCLAACIVVLLSLVSVGLAPLTFSNKEEISQLSTTVDALKRDQDDTRQLSTTVDALKRDQDDMRQLSTTVDVLKLDQDNVSTTVDALKRDLDNERSRTAALEQRLNEIGKTLQSCPGGHTLWRGTCYKVFDTKKPFSEGAAICHKDGGTLATPRDAETNAFLVSLYKPVGNKWSDFWFGLHDQREEGSFEWVDGSTLGAYNHWAPGEPNNDLGNEDCVQYSTRPSKKDKWNDYPCHLPLRFICQAAPGRP